MARRRFSRTATGRFTKRRSTTRRKATGSRRRSTRRGRR